MAENSHLKVKRVRIGVKDFTNFVKFFHKDLNEQLAMDIFMLLTRRLASLLTGKPDLEKKDDGLESPASPGMRNRDLGSALRKEEVKQYGLTQTEINKVTLDLATLDEEYNKFKSNDDSTSDLINPKITKLRNIDFRLKLDAWKNMASIRKNMKKRTFEHGKALRQTFEVSKNLFTMDKHRIVQCINAYNGLCDDKTKHEKDQKTINNFLRQLPEGSHSILELSDLERLQKNELSKYQTKIQMLHEFVAAVKQECVIEQNFFIFFDIPDLIVKKKYSRKDYDEIIKIVCKVKLEYLAEKAKSMPDKPASQTAVITDDDLVALELFDVVLSQHEFKAKEKRETIQHFYNECREHVARSTKVQGQSYSEKTKKNIEQGSLIDFINKRMEQRAEVYFTNNFKHRNLYQVFIR